jgi:hypothetical protein
MARTIFAAIAVVASVEAMLAFLFGLLRSKSEIA